MNHYCASRYQATRNQTSVVRIGNIELGGSNPIRIQSMTNTPTQDVEATVKQCIALYEAGCEIVRVTAQNVAAAKALKNIRKKLNDAKISAPLVADIHFLPKAAMEAVEHIEKVRVNPGNYADKKKFAVLEYSDKDYQEELERLHDAFSPLVLRAKELGRALRIGTNHGSLSDRIMNRYGDTPLGMVESALEFVRIAEHHGFKNIVLSLKASNPKVMIQAYRLAVTMMKDENMHYPLHLGVTEAGDGEDARIKSAIGIGSLLADGIGDTIRVSLTEDPVYEIPVAQELAKMAHKLWESSHNESQHDSINPFEYARREPTPVEIVQDCTLSSTTPPAVVVKTHKRLSNYHQIVKEVLANNAPNSETKVEGLLIEVGSNEDFVQLTFLQKILSDSVKFFVLELAEEISLSCLEEFTFSQDIGWVISRKFESNEDAALLERLLEFGEENNITINIDTKPEFLGDLRPILEEIQPKNVTISASSPSPNMHPIGTHRAIAQKVKSYDCPQIPIWLRNTAENAINCQDFFTSKLLEASTFSGNLLCDGIGDMISVETEAEFQRANVLAYNILQGARLRLTKAEFVACPSCGRTLFDLESTTQKVREKTGHLKGVTIAIMGCIVNGPGEMADADFGYVGGARGKINLYVGKKCVQYHIPQEEAVERLIDLIKEHDKWVEPTEILTSI